MNTESKITYYDLLSDDGTVGGILRRTHGGQVPVYETFRRDLTWKPSEFLKRYYIGRVDNDYREISSSEAFDKIAKWTKKWATE